MGIERIDVLTPRIGGADGASAGPGAAAASGAPGTVVTGGGATLNVVPPLCSTFTGVVSPVSVVLLAITCGYHRYCDVMY